VRRKATGRVSPESGHLLAVGTSNRPDTSGVLGPRGSPRGSGEFVKETMIAMSAPAGTLDAATVVTANGPRDRSDPSWVICLSALSFRLPVHPEWS